MYVYPSLSLYIYIYITVYDICIYSIYNEIDGVHVYMTYVRAT